MEIISLRDNKELLNKAAKWFSSKWGVDEAAYLKCMNEYLNNQTEYGWYLCIDNNEIVGGVGVIDNDFHERKDLTPNICALYVEKDYRNKGIAGKLLNKALDDLYQKNIKTVYLLTDHEGFYERYDWKFYDMVANDFEDSKSRLYVYEH